ncbi:hypothetical protein MNB_SUP05-SYMBIONT-4-652 [hydrothermal vent metagenome]|uniref:Uncharacterized protein n=1 Tax=hydrothermal vent metagenome TaxID=652676 RepID=A0A1W1DZA1_9ZZZZ
MVGVITFKTLIGGLFLFWFLSVVLMTQKTMSNNRMSVKEAGMLWIKALFVVLLVMVMLIIDFK